MSRKNNLKAFSKHESIKIQIYKIRSNRKNFLKKYLLLTLIGIKNGRIMYIIFNLRKSMSRIQIHNIINQIFPAGTNFHFLVIGIIKFNQISNFLEIHQDRKLKMKIVYRNNNRIQKLNKLEIQILMICIILMKIKNY